MTSDSKGPVPWTENEFFRYLRNGYSPLHGVATGPMAPVVRELEALPDADIRAMASYLASFNSPVSESQAAASAQLAIKEAQNRAPLPGPAQALFNGACAACHHDGQGPRLLGANVPLALNSNLHSDSPDNLLRTILEGHTDPATKDIGFMPSFRSALDDRQIVELAAYMRQRFAPSKPAWSDLEASSARIRSTPAMR